MIRIIGGRAGRTFQPRSYRVEGRTNLFVERRGDYRAILLGVVAALLFIWVTQ